MRSALTASRLVRAVSRATVLLRGADTLPHNAVLIVKLLHSLKYNCLEAHTVWARS